MWSVVHHQKRDAVVEPKLEDADDMGMDEARNGLRFLQKRLLSGWIQLLREHFDGGLGLEVAMFAQVDLGIAPFSQQRLQGIVAYLLADAISHRASFSHPACRG